MKLIIFSVILLLSYNSLQIVESKMTLEQVKNTLRPIKNTCVKKIAIDEALTEGTKQGEFPNDENLMCFMRCVLQMLKMMKNGEILLPIILSQVDLMMPEEYTDRLKEIFTKCHGEVESLEESCEKAFEFIKCFYSADSELYFFP